MTTTTITTKTPQGIADATFVVPDGAGPFPLVVLYPDAGGLRDATTKAAEHVAGMGYAVLAPNPFWRQQPYAPFDLTTVWGDASERGRLMTMIGKVSAAEACADTVALVAAIEDPRVRHERFATMGYCMGGRLAYIVATMVPERVVATAPIHAGGLVNDTPESPHLLAPKLRAAMYFAVADQDPSCTPEHQAKLKAALDAAGVRSQIELHEGAKHGFGMSDAPVYDAKATARVWGRLEALFADHLRAA